MVGWWRWCLRLRVAAAAAAAASRRDAATPCVGGGVEATASLVCYKLPETGSTWFASLLNDFSEVVAVQHQWVKATWEDTKSRATPARRGEFIRLSARCPTRRGMCYKSHEPVASACVT